MAKKCKSCNGKLKVIKGQGIGYTVSKCEKCNQYYYFGDKRSKFVIKKGIKYVNYNA